MKTILVTLLVLIALAVLFGLWVMYSGVYNVAAVNPHTAIMKWVLSTTSDNSVKAHADDIKAPDLSDTTMILTGIAHYNGMCVDCHGAPGRKRNEFAKGLNPHPPSLAAAVDDWNDGELFWIVKNGYKMTGMPGFAPTHTDAEIWDIVAFLRKLPDIDGAQYNAMLARAKADGLMEESEMEMGEEAGGGH